MDEAEVISQAMRLLRSRPRRSQGRKCPVCQTEFTTIGRGEYCSHKCRQAAYRERQRTRKDDR